MLKFILYCDLSTMNCKPSDINAELSSFADSYVQVNDAIWFFKYPDHFNGSYLPKEEHLFYEHFNKFTNENSIIFLSVLDNNYYYNLPVAANNFLGLD